MIRAAEAVRRHALAIVLIGGTALAGCSGGPQSSMPGSSATPTARPEPSSPGFPEQPVIVTFRVGETEEFRVRLVEPADIAVAYGLLAGRTEPSIPNGRLVRGEPDVNAGHPWSLDPRDFEFADITTEVCDGLPSAVDGPAFTADRYCPWSAKVVAIEPMPQR